jgi:4-amino-4-deoxy-L-arabinose transferase-like glycosyltransferase
MPPSAKLIRFFAAYGWAAVWLAVILAALSTRPLLPVDETRYVAAAWEMWQRGDFLVPHLNGETYAHKPPLMFWAMHLGWNLFGVGDVWPRLVSPLAALAALLATRALAQALWPERRYIALYASWLLIGAFFWIVFSTVTMFDMWNAALTGLGVLGLIAAIKGKTVKGFALVGLAIGLGVLAKGPVIMLYILPVAVLAPWWSPPDTPVRWRTWYLGILGAVMGGAAIALAWALPAANAGGEAYAQAIFWGQTAGRVEDSFAHGRPLWWYLPLLPAMLLPWAVWPKLWRGRLSFPARTQWQLRLALSWFVPAFVAFSMISGKQPHYMIPLLPALALLAAHRLSSDPRIGNRGLLLPGGLLLIFGLAMTALNATLKFAPETTSSLRLPVWAQDISVLFGISVIALGAIVVLFRSQKTLPQVVILALTMPALVISIHLMIMTAAAPAYDLSRISNLIAAHHDRGQPVAFVGKYHGQFHFPGRLEVPLVVIEGSEIRDWSSRHPEGVIVMTYRGELTGPSGPVFSQPYRGRGLALWSHDAIAANRVMFK